MLAMKTTLASLCCLAMVCQAQLWDLNNFFSHPKRSVATLEMKARMKVHHMTEGPDGEEIHACDRECIQGENFECHYDFKVELYNSLSKACYDCPTNITDCSRRHCISADGMERGLITINRKMPGTPVVVCQGDRVVVNVDNHLHTETTSIHWHGETMKEQQYMDGTPHVTQCGIMPSAKFQYNFIAKDAGTHFYHSHTSFQRGDGAFGPYIVRQPREVEPHSDLYDEDLTDHVIFPQEWFHMSSREAFVLHHWDTGKNKADNLLINGKGRFRKFGPDEDVATPTAVFEVKTGLRYRFRIISPGFTLCPIMVSVDNHELLVIASDGLPVEPMQVKSLVIHPGERYDFVLTADQPSGTYFMRFAGLFDCSKYKAHAVGRLHYDDTELEEVTEDTKYEDCIDNVGPVLNALNYAPANETMNFKPEWIPVTMLKGLEGKDCVPEDVAQGQFVKACDRPEALREVPDRVFYLGYDLFAKDNPHFHDPDLYSYDQVEGQNKLRTPQINNITCAFPVSPPLSQESDIDPSLFCDSESLQDKDCGEKDWCECVHTLKVGLNEVVELVLVDEGVPYDVSHPMHIHGMKFYVVAMERHAKNLSHIGAGPGEGNFLNIEKVKEMDKSGEIERNLVDPPLKDTVSVPDSGFTIVRIHADNPGYWFFHCHMSWHNHLGMGLIFKVGDIQKDVAPPPPNFPKCGNFP